MFELNLQRALIGDRYEVKGRIGSGSYSEVLIALDRERNRNVVIKALNTHLQGPPYPELEQMLKDKFENEAAVLKRIQHPNIVSILEEGDDEDRSGEVFSFLVLEFMAGGDLMEHCRSLTEQKIGLAEVLVYLKQVCDGLAYAHSCGVIHRDLKPENLLLSADRRIIKIADFGVAKSHNLEYSPITRVGTPAYSAPEHSPLSDDEECATLTSAADIYALAKTCFTMLCGRVPVEFAGKTITALPSLENHLWAAECLNILKRATAREAAKRYGSVTEFWNDFVTLATFDRAITRAISFKTPTPEESELTRKRAELAPLEAILAQCELELATLQAELRDFEATYLTIVGARYAELDDIEAQIAEALSKLNPTDHESQAKAEDARRQAAESAAASESARDKGELSKALPSESLKKLRREAARLIHPDTVLDDREKQRHHEWMAKVNEAFDDRDEKRLRYLLNQWESSPESVKGEGIGSELVRIIRRIALVEERLTTVEREIIALRESPLFELKSRVDEVEAEGGDLLKDMEAFALYKIDEASSRLEQLVQTKAAL
jgi:serine/threonine protein kinase